MLPVHRASDGMRDQLVPRSKPAPLTIPPSTQHLEDLPPVLTQGISAVKRVQRDHKETPELRALKQATVHGNSQEFDNILQSFSDAKEASQAIFKLFEHCASRKRAGLRVYS